MQRLAELILTEITARIDTLSADQAREVVTALQEKYTPGADLPTCPPKSSLPEESPQPTRSSEPTTNQLSEPTSLSAELPLGAGAELQFTTLESSATLSEMSLSSRARPRAASITTRQDDVSAIVETKPIIDDAKDVTAIATPEISAAHEAIVDDAKEVTAIKTPKIAAAALAIVDDTPDVREIEAATIVSTAQPIAQPTATPTGGLRAAHVVQPSTDVDDIIEAEVIFMDD